MMKTVSNNLIDNRQIRVFISSTFRDMQDERDELMKKTFPMLRQMAAERDVTLTEVDLRWGITEEESKSGKVVEICLREIENSVPFFIGIIGNRYGWIPKPEDIGGGSLSERFPDVPKYVERHLSVTEMEMQFGVLARPEDMHAYFFIKEPEIPDEEEPEKLAALKKAVRVNKRYPVSNYSSREDLARQVEEAFRKLLDYLFPEGTLSALEKERLGQRAYMNSLCQIYIRTEKNFAAIDEWMKDWEKHQLVITGASGLGKSALVANWTKNKLTKEKELPYKIVYHAVGSGGSLGSDWHVVKSLCDEIRDLYGFDADEASPKTDEKALQELFDRVAFEGDKPLLIVLDAVNQIIDVHYSKRLNWLPIPPKNVKMLFTTLEDDETMQVFQDRHYPVYTLQPLTREERVQMVHEYLSIFSKKLKPEQVARIVDDRQSVNTLVMKTLLDELVNFGIYEKLDEKIEEFLKPDSYEDFYQVLLQNYEASFSEPLVRHFLSLIAVSRNGLSEDEILSITQEKPLHWSQFFCSFRQHLIVKNGLVSFSHSYIREAVEGRYINGCEDWVKTCRHEIIEYFQKQDSPRAWEELSFQFNNTNQTHELYALIIRFPVFDFFYLTNPVEMGRYWSTIIENTGFSIRDYEAQEIPDEDLVYYYTHVAVFAIQYLNDYSAAVLFNEKIIDDASSSAPDMLSVAYNNIAISLGHIGEYDKAIAYIQKSIRLDEASHNELGLANSYNNLGTFYNEIGDNEDAVTAYETSVTIRKRILGENHTDIAQSYNNLAIAFHGLGRFQEAKEYHEKALMIKISRYGDKSWEVAYSYNNLGTLSNECGDYESAERYYGKALEIYAASLGVNHSLYLDAYYNAVKNKYENKKISAGEALSANLYILNARIRRMGVECPDVADSYQRLGEIYYDLEDYISSKSSFNKSLSIRNSMQGSVVDIRKIEQYLAYVEYNLGDYLEAARHFERVLSIQEQMGQDRDDENYLYATTSTAQMFEYAGQYEKAIEYYTRSAALIRAAAKMDPEALAISLNGIAWCLHLLGRNQEGLPYVKEALQYDTDNMNIVDTESCICMAIGDYENAISSCNRLMAYYMEQNDEKNIRIIRERLNQLQAEH